MDIFIFILIGIMVIYSFMNICHYKLYLGMLNSDKNKVLTDDTLVEDFLYYLKKYNLIESEKDVIEVKRFDKYIEFYINEKLYDKRIIRKYKKINKKLEKIYKDKFKTIIAYNESHKII